MHHGLGLLKSLTPKLPLRLCKQETSLPCTSHFTRTGDLCLLSAIMFTLMSTSDTNFGHFLTVMHNPFASPARMIIGAARLYFPFKGKVSMVRRVARWCDSTKAIRYEPWKTPTVVGPARLGKRFPKSEYRKLEIRGRSVLTPDGGFLLCVSPRSAFCLYVCTVTWKLAASLKSQFDVCDHFLENQGSRLVDAHRKM